VYICAVETYIQYIGQGLYRVHRNLAVNDGHEILHRKHKHDVMMLLISTWRGEEKCKAGMSEEVEETREHDRSTVVLCAGYAN